MLIKGKKGQYDVNQGSKGDGLKMIFLCACRDGKTLLDLQRAVKNIVGCEFVWNWVKIA